MTVDSLVPSGSSIGRYVVLGWIARGAMGDVYTAYDPDLGRKVAIKVLRVKRGAAVGDVDGRTRLLREAQAIAKLSHPNVVIVHDVGCYEDRVFVAMELIEGGTLSFWLHAQPRTWREILKVFIAAGRGLQHAHEANLVHRDFKPENAMVRLDGEVRVMDFGLVRYVDLPETTPTPGSSCRDDEPVRDDEMALTWTANLALPVSGHPPSGDSEALQAWLTEPGFVIGTPAYMAPEQFAGQIADARSDQFSFCVALYEALFGVRPFCGTTMAVLAGNVLTGHVKPPPERSEVPVIVWQALRRGLSVTPADRYPSMKELLADLMRHPEPLRRRVPTTETLATAADLASLLETLLQMPVQAKQRESKPSHEQGVVAVYAGDDGSAAALVHFDLLAAGSTAAALTLVPPSAVQAASVAEELPQLLMDNLFEVANVLTKLVRGMSTARLRIQSISALPGAVPPGIVALLETPPCFVSFDVSVSAYPEGRITVIGRGPRAAVISHERERVLSRALIIDDSAAMRLVIGRALRRMGVIEILEARNGEEGLRCLHEGTAIDAVFVDWSMPVMDGISFVRAVRADRSLDQPRIVMVTTEDEQEQVEAAFGAGADEYLVKPISEESLGDKLERIGLKTASPEAASGRA